MRTTPPKKIALLVSSFKVSLLIIDGMKRTVALAQSFHCDYKIEHKNIEVTMDEEQIPLFLHALSEAKVSFASIKIQEPSLEDFFIQIAKSL